MKTKTTKIALSFVFVCIFILSATCVQALTYEDFEYEYTEDGTGICITGYTNYETNLVIPDTIENKPVVEISSYAFGNMNNIISITFGKNLVKIGAEAFYGCRGLTGTLDLPTSVEYIGVYAFSRTNLTKVTLNGKTVYGETEDGYIYSMDLDENGLIIEDIVEEKFQNLETIIIPSAIAGQNVIDVWAYFGNTSLKKVIFNNKVIYGVTDDGYKYYEADTGIFIDDILIEKFEGVEEITVPNTIEGKEVVSVWLYLQGDIKKIYFKDKIYSGVTEEGLCYHQNDDDTITIDYYKTEYDEEGNVKAIDVIIPDTIEGMKVTTIGGSAFYYADINSITFGKNVTTIADKAFFMATFTNTILDLPTNTTNIADTAFRYTNVSVTQGGKKLIAIYDNIQYMFRDNCAIITGFTRDVANNVVLPSSVYNIPVVEIADSAFMTTRYDNLGDNIETLTIPSSITKIGDRAFGRILAFGMGSPDPYWDGRVLAYDIHFEGNAPEITEYTFSSYKGTVTYAEGKTGYDTEVWKEVLGITVDTEDIATATIDAIEDKTYTGSAITPKPVVKVESTTLVEGTDYTLTYNNNVNVGTATITVTGKGNYTGTKVVTFNIIEPEVVDPNDAGYINFNIDKTVSYDKGTVTVKITAAKPVTDYEIVLTLDNITENITVVNKLAGSNEKIKDNTVTMYMIQLSSQADKTVYPVGTVLAEITYTIPEGYFEANKGFDGTATVVNTCAVRITDNGTNYEYSLTKNVTVKEINVQEILQETLKEITIANNSVQGIKASLEQATGMTVRIKNIDGVVLEKDSKVGTGTVVEVLDASGNVVSSETVSINGEINGDGEIDFFDAIQMISLVYDTDENFEWNEAVRNAAKFGEEGIPEFFDIITLISYIYG